MIYDGHSLFFFSSPTFSHAYLFSAQIYIFRVDGSAPEFLPIDWRVTSKVTNTKSPPTDDQLSPRKSINLGIDVSFSLRLWSIN
jgi:hypothetical protein